MDGRWLLALVACAFALPAAAEAPGDGPGSPLSAQKAEAPDFSRDTGAPAGFEHLDAPQQLLVDVLYGGQELSPAEAEFGPGFFRFLDPERVALEIPGIAFAPRVIEALSGDLEPNTDFACVEPQVPLGCGLLDPEIAGVIFDPDRFQVEIFVDRGHLILASLLIDDTLPPPRSAWTGTATLGGSFSGSSGTTPRYDMRLDGVLAHGPAHLRFVGDLRNGRQLGVDRAVATVDWRDWQLDAGLFRSRSVRAVGERDLAGLRLASSLKTRTKVFLDRAYGTRLPVFLNRRSLVQILRDGRLLSSGVYDAGNQQLDTSALPEGAYEVEIDIQDRISGRRRERRFFAKTTELPPLGSPAFPAGVGLLRDRRRGENGVRIEASPFVRAGATLRQTERTGSSADLVFLDDEALASLGAFYFDPHFTLRGGPVASHRGVGGLEALVAAEFEPHFASVYTRGLWGTRGGGQFFGDRTDVTFNAGTTWRKARIMLRADLRRRANDRLRYAVTPTVRVPLMRRSRLRGDLSVEYSHSDRGHLALLRVEFARWSPDWQIQHRGAVRIQDDRGPLTSVEGDLGLAWSSGSRWPADLRTRLQATRVRDRSSLGFAADLRSDRGGLSGFTEQVFRDEANAETLYGGQWSVGLAGDREGLLLGGESGGQSALLIDLRGAPLGEPFEILANDIRIGDARVGTPKVVPIAPYSHYEIRIEPKGEHFASFDGAARTVTLYPGSSVRLRWEVEQIYVLLAAVVDPSGEPVAQARIKTAELMS